MQYQDTINLFHVCLIAIWKENHLLAFVSMPKSCTKAITSEPQIVTYTVREKGMEHKREQR